MLVLIADVVLCMSILLLSYYVASGGGLEFTRFPGRLGSDALAKQPKD